MIGLLALSLTTPYCPMSALFICQEVAFGGLKTKENFKLLALKSVRGRLLGVVATRGSTVTQILTVIFSVSGIV